MSTLRGGGALTNAQWPTCSYTPYCCGSLSPRIELEPYNLSNMRSWQEFWRPSCPGRIEEKIWLEKIGRARGKEGGRKREGENVGVQLLFRRILSFCVDSEWEEALKFLPS